MSFLKKVSSVLGVTEKAFTVDQKKFGEGVAEKLQIAASVHLHAGKGFIAQTFRGAFLPQNIAKKFITKRNPSTGTYIEAAALGELLGCHVVVSSPGNHHLTCLYRAEDLNTPTVILRTNEHGTWMVDGKPFAEDNALYIAFAKALQTLVQSGLSQSVSLKVGPSSASHDLDPFVQPQRELTVAQFKALRAKITECIRKFITPSQATARFESEQSRISTLPPDEQKKIASDHGIKRTAAAQPMSHQTHNLFQRIVGHNDFPKRYHEQHKPRTGNPHP